MFYLYQLIAVFGAIVNFLAQELCSSYFKNIVLIMFVGVFCNVVFKYIFVSRFVFNYKSKDSKEAAVVFTKYSLFGIVPTVLFLGIEYIFYAFYPTDWGRRLGIVIAIFISSAVKYYFDKRYVFPVRSDNK